MRMLLVGLILAAAPSRGEDIADVTGVTGSGTTIVLFAAAAVLLLALIFRPAARHFVDLMNSKSGELRVRRALEKRSPDVLHDFILPGANGGLVKIDHAILTAGGILCIQTKHCNGIVFGERDDPQWIYIDGSARRRFLNPLIQNEGRTRALRKVVPDVPVANLVVFTGKIDFPAPPPKNVIPVSRLDSYIAKFVFGPSKVKDWDAAWLTVKSAALTDPESRKDLQAQLTTS